METTYIGEHKFFDFSDGVPINDLQIEIWINRCINLVKEKMKNGAKEAFGTISSGNTKVLCEGYKNNNGDATMYISVITSYKQATLLNEKI